MDESMAKALGLIARRQVVHFSLSDEGQNVYPNGYVYAMARSVYPLFETELGLAEGREEMLRLDPFLEAFDVPREAVNAVAKWFDEGSQRGEKRTFRDAEAYFGGGWTGRHVRVDLIHIFRYFHLSDRFAQESWDALMSDTPVEANGITRDLDTIHDFSPL